MMRGFFEVGYLMVLSAVLAGCSNTIKDIGRPPALSGVAPVYAERALAMPVSKDPATASRFSRWNDNKGDLFSGKLATSPGDILTVVVKINDRARFNNRSDSSRSSGRSLNGQGQFSIVGVGKDADGSASLGSSSTFNGSGDTTRSETIELSVAVVVEETFPNGNVLVSGTQEVRVNSELRVLSITGIVRPSDIEPNNTISYERIAEARISYGGRGHISHVQRPPYGQQILNRILPF